MEFRLPELGEGVTEGELVKWRVAAGETIKDDQPICEVMTDKATIEIPSPFSGVVEELVAKEGQIVKVHELMLKMEVKGGAKVAAAAHAPAHSAPVAAKSAPVAAVQAAPVMQSSQNVLASPATRKVAREKGVNLAAVQASGPYGRVLMDDVLKALNQGTGAMSAGTPKMANQNLSSLEERIPIRGIRKRLQGWNAHRSLAEGIVILF